jgi:coatomer subunit beta'
MAVAGNMPLKLEAKKKLSSRTDRVKSIEIHPVQPWVVSGLYNGTVIIYDYITQAALKSFEVSNAPVRAVRFIVRMQWMVIGSDDKFIRVYNYNTLEKLTSFEAHDDYIRSMVPHPSLPLLLTSSDDCTIKVWNWKENWTEPRVYEGHGHYVMQTVLNPKDFNTFATASLDKTIKIWGIAGSLTPHFTLIGHTQGVNCLEYFRGGEKPYLVSGGDDMVIKLWDYQTKQCVHTLEGHHHNISSVSFHPDLPLIVSTSEDCTVKLWHSSTFRLETTLNHSMERCWAHATLPGSKLLALAYDEGTLVLKLGNDEPVASMTSSGYVVWAKQNEIFSCNLRISDSTTNEGDLVPLVPRETETCEMFPQDIKHSPNGRSFVICGDGEYIIKGSRAFKNQGYGSAQEFVWSTSIAGDFALKDQSRIRLMRGSEERLSFRPNFSFDCLFGGYLIGVRGEDFICFYEWEKGSLIRRIDTCPKQVCWSDSGLKLALVMEENVFILTYNRDLVNAQATLAEDGCEDAFTLDQELYDSSTSALWLSDCFMYTTRGNKLSYCLGGKVMQLQNLDRRLYLLGYVNQQNRVYLIDSEFNVTSFEVLQSFIEYQQAIAQEDFERAEQLFPQIPENYHTRCARYLQSHKLLEDAMEITKDKEHKFELAIELGRLEVAYALAQEEMGTGEAKWKTVGDLALLNGHIELAEECMLRSKDLNGLLLVYSSIGVVSKMRSLAALALENCKYNVAFLALFLLKDLSGCIDCLVRAGRIPEAAFFARSYCPSEISRVVKMWKDDLSKLSKVASQSLSDPLEYPQQFPELTLGIKAEQVLKRFYDKTLPAKSAMMGQALLSLDVLEAVKESEEVDIEQLLSAPPECPEDPMSS